MKTAFPATTPRRHTTCGRPNKSEASQNEHHPRQEWQWPCRKKWNHGKVDRILLRAVQLPEQSRPGCTECPWVNKWRLMDYPVVCEKAEATIRSLKSGKIAGIDNIPAELLKHGWESVVDILTIICNKIWQTSEWPTPWMQSIIVLPKKRNLQLCQNYQTISLISHASKVMLRIILNRLRPQAEGIIAKEQARFRKGRSTIEQIFNLHSLCEASPTPERTLPCLHWLQEGI